jgi:tRNA threonylcarbamoyladenosine biosynthesis protein TsaB
VSTLAAIAQGVYREFKTKHILSSLDARMGEVYWGAYRLGQDDIMELSGNERVLKPEQVSLSVEGPGWIGAGSGWDTYHEVMLQQLDNIVGGWKKGIYPHARDVATLAAKYFKNGGAVPPEKALPVYLRDEVAWKKS